MKKARNRKKTKAQVINEILKELEKKQYELAQKLLNLKGATQYGS